MLDRQTVEHELQQAGHHTHGLAALFPLMTQDEFDALKASIAQNGQREPALLWGSLILDGVHRTLACVQLGIKPRFVAFSGTGQEARARVLDLNLHRRHLSVGQRAMIAADLAQRKPGEGGDADDAAPTQAEAAAMMSVGERSVRQAKKIAAEAAPEVVEGVRTGEVTLNAAAGMMERSGPNGRQPEIEAVKEGSPEEVDPTGPFPSERDICGQCRKIVGEGRLHDNLCIDCRNKNLAASLPHDCTQCGKRTDGGLLYDGVCLDCRTKEDEVPQEPTYTYECFLCGDALGDDDVEWLNELPTCATCHAQAEPEDVEATSPGGWEPATGEYSGYLYQKTMGNIRYRVHQGFEWEARVGGDFVVMSLEKQRTPALACAAAEDWHRVWIVAAHGEAAPNALIDTPAAYSASDNEFMGEMAAGESLDDVVGV